MTTTLPIVDLSLSDRHAATIVRDACTRYGFMFVTNHGIGAAAIRDTFAQIRAFFALPVDEKLRMRLDANNRGYSPLFEQDLDPANQRYHGDTCEGLYFGREVVDGDPESALPLHGPNQWPDEARLPQFRRVVEAYFEACRVLGMRVIRLLALALDLPANHFDADFEKPTILLRPLHYPPTPSAPEEGRFGAGAHTDYGMITLLMTDGEPGLQIQVDPSDPASWQDVPHLPGAFIVNLGDMLQCWTNDRFRSTMHRVVIQDRGRDRFSLPYFIEPNFHTLVECLPTCRSEDGSAKHEPISAGEYLLAKYARVHKDFKAFHEKAEAMPSGQRDAASTCDKT